MSHSSLAVMRQPTPAIGYHLKPGAAAAVAHDPATDRELVSLVLAGDKRAEERLYRAHVRAVSALAARLLGRSDEAQDVIQDAFLSALSRLPQLRDGALFRAWLLRITVHEVHRRFRRRKLLRLLGFAGGVDDCALAELATPGMSADEHVELTCLDRVLASMPTRERIAWMLRHVEGYELTEVASACDTSLASVKRWIARADERLRAHIRPEAGR